MSLQWFGAAHGAAFEEDTPHAATPVGETCARCGEPIAEADDGWLVDSAASGQWKALPFHHECHLRGIIGGINHQLGRCTCCGGTEPPDPIDMSRREAAVLAVKHWIDNQ